MAAFNGDKFISQEVANLIAKHKIQTAVETGTYHGDTTVYLATLVPTVHTIEINKSYYEISDKRFSDDKSLNGTIRRYLGSSPLILKSILSKIDGPVFFFLDAHWGYCCPLCEELVAIGKRCPDRAVIAVHDFFVPGKDFGFDTYQGKRFDYDYIEPYLDNIYPSGFTHKYNEEAEGSRRGIIYLEPKLL